MAAGALDGILAGGETGGVPTFGPRMTCTRCGIIGADVRINPVCGGERLHQRPLKFPCKS
jgi:hypothetical protein